MLKVTILGATGYAGQELARILLAHPETEICGLGSQNYAGQVYSRIYPHFKGFLDLQCKDMKDSSLIAEADVVFLALPHGLSASLAKEILENDKKVIDLGADFRLKSPAVYNEWYKTAGPSAEELAEAVYGLPEINRDIIKKANLVANPGCYPTTIILGLAPLLKEKLIDTRFIIADSKSGVSGAGRSLRVTSLFCEVNEDFKAYSVPRHRHTPEIEQELSVLAGEEIKITFTPHLVPMTRGMLSTIYTIPREPVAIKSLEKLYLDFYRDEPFIRIYTGGEYPQTKWVCGTNNCDIGLALDERTGRLIVISAIDNLIKGASGQAVQNMNILCGIDETLGLKQVAVYP